MRAVSPCPPPYRSSGHLIGRSSASCIPLPPSLPQLGAFDWKEFCELYPGIIGWAIVNLAMAHKQVWGEGRGGGARVVRTAFSALPLRCPPRSVRS